MKILLVTPYYTTVGGLEVYARNQAKALRIHGADVTVVASRHDPGPDTIDTEDGIRIYRLAYWFKLWNTPVNPLWPFKIRRIISAEKPDIVNAHTPVPTMALSAAAVALHLPFVITYHAATLLKGNKWLFDAVARVYGQFEKIMLRRADQVFAVSQYVKSQLPEFTRDKTVVIPNSVMAASIRPRTQPHTESFLFIGSLEKTHQWKGLDQTIQAIARYKHEFGGNPTLVVMGGGNYKTHYQKLATELGVASAVKFMGVQTGANKLRILRAATALIAYPTSSNDAFPTVFLEAWANGVPVVAAAIGPIPSLIQDNVTGFLVEPNDPTALAHKLHWVVNFKDLRSYAAKHSLEHVRVNYTWERQAKVVLAQFGGLK